MARRRDRRFGPGPHIPGFATDAALWGDGFPFDVPALAAVEELRLDVPVTLLAGENGSDKSMILEPGADGSPHRPYEGLDSMRLARDSLAAPERHPRAALAEPASD